MKRIATAVAFASTVMLTGCLGTTAELLALTTSLSDCGRLNSDKTAWANWNWGNEEKEEREPYTPHPNQDVGNVPPNKMHLTSCEHRKRIGWFITEEEFRKCVRKKRIYGLRKE